MTVIVQGPGGVKVGFPDGTPPEAIKEAMRKHFGTPEPKHDLGGDLLRSAGAGLERGAIGLAGMVSDLPEMVGNLVVKGADWAGRKTGGKGLPGMKVDLPGGADDITKFVEKHAGPIYQPQTTPGRYLESGIEWGAPMIVGGPMSLGRMAARAGTGAIGGLASEGAGEVTDNPWIKTGAGVAAMLLTGGRGALKSNAGKQAAKALKGVTPEELKQAQALQAAGHEVGVPLSAGESLPQAAGLASDVMASSAGYPTMQRFFGKRPAQVQSAVQGRAAELGPTLGRPNPRQAIKDVQGGAEKAIQGAEQARTAASSPFYQAAAQQRVPVQSMMPVLKELDDAIRNSGSAAVKGPLKALRDELSPPTKSALTGKPLRRIETSVGKLDEIRKVWRDRTKLEPFANEALDKTTAAKMGPILKRLRDDVLVKHSPDYAKGRQAYIDNSPPVERLLESEIGQLAEAKGIRKAFEQILDPETARPGNIAFVQRTLSATKPGAFRDVARVFLENRLSSALRNETSTAGAKLKTAIAGTPIQEANLKAMLEAAARDAGVNPSGLWAGWKKMLDVLGRTNTIPGIGSRTGPRVAMQAEAGSSRIASAVEGVNPFSIPRQAASAIRGRVSDQTYRTLAEALTAPDSLQKIKALAMMSGKKAELMGNSIVAGFREMVEPQGRQNLPVQSGVVSEQPGLKTPGHPAAIGPFPDGSTLPWDKWIALGRPDVRSLPTAPQ